MHSVGGIHHGHTALHIVNNRGTPGAGCTQSLKQWYLVICLNQ
jgi:hypothetical protein